MENDVVSLLPKLEPALGIAFALNLAYIGLPRFRYRETIRDHVRTKMLEMGEVPEHICSTVWYKQIDRLRSLDNHDGDEQGKLPATKMPDGLWSALYVGLFERHFDRRIIVSLSVLCAGLVFLGVAHEIDHLDITRTLFTGWLAKLWLWATACASLIPVVSVALGAVVVTGAKKFVNECITNLKLAYQQEARDAKLPEGPLVQASFPQQVAAIATAAVVK